MDAQGPEELRHSPLDAVHRELGAKMVPFGGWDMPVAYPAGTIAEHKACREDAVVFDVSHLGTLRVQGPGALDALQRTFTNDLTKVAPGRAQYTHMLDAADASVLDDIIVWWRDAELFDVMPNASNTERVSSALEALETGAGIESEDITHTRAVLAVQGPNARERLAAIAPDLASLKRFGVATLDVAGVSCVVAGTGYTGEAGVEIAVPVDSAEAVLRAVLALGVAPAGLGARDTLRLEAGLPLHGHELGAGITTLQAGLGWVVAWGKPEFRGREALAAEKERGVSRLLRGLRLEGRQPAREGSPVLGADGTQIGTVSSGNFSPMLGVAVAMAFLPPELAAGATVGVEVRGKALPATVVDLPFVKKA